MDESEFNPRDVARELHRRPLYDPVAITTLVAHGIGPEDAGSLAGRTPNEENRWKIRYKKDSKSLEAPRGQLKTKR